MASTCCHHPVNDLNVRDYQKEGLQRKECFWTVAGGRRSRETQRSEGERGLENIHAWERPMREAVGFHSSR